MNVSVERCEGLRRSEMSCSRCRSLLAVGWAPATWNTGGKRCDPKSCWPRLRRCCAISHPNDQVPFVQFVIISAMPRPPPSALRVAAWPPTPTTLYSLSRVATPDCNRPLSCARVSIREHVRFTCPGHMRNVVAWRLLSFRFFSDFTFLV